MKRSQFDKLLSSVGVVMVAVLLIGAGLLYYAHNFVHKQVHDQLAEQQITFPPVGPALANLPKEDADAMAAYAGQQLLTGAQAETYANHFIRAHLAHVAEGKTYAQVSAAAMADPTNAKLAGQANTLFKGETLRGLLLNAYAFDTMAVIARWLALAALLGAALLGLFVVLGFKHAGNSTGKRRK
jgi:hypothetical protein